ncbi:MAG: protein kinase [Clostridia bacterium]|nr:protein kinase [Clostridia bacterium]
MEARLIGKVIKRRFRVEEVVGRGGMAIVYRAFDLRTHQTVALKMLREEYENDPEYRARFSREAEVCRKLNHPNVVNLIDSGVVGSMAYIAFEYVDGETLKERIVRLGRLNQEEAVHCALQILAALSHAHQRGIVHRDVKPQNVLVSKTGQLKIGDFGIAGMAETQTLTSDGNVIGSVHYFSPEQAKGMRATAASDLYSVGVILYEMLTGHVPFDGETAVSVAMMHLMEPVKPIEQEVDVCRAVELIVKMALEKKPQSRYQSADAVIRDLRRALRHPDGEFLAQRKAAMEDPRRAQREERRRELRSRIPLRPIAIALSAVLTVLIVLGAISLYNTMFVYVRMPELTDLDQSTAQRMIDSSDLNVQWLYSYSEVTEGFVCAQNPPARTDVKRGETVQVTISQGSDMLSMPKVVSMTLDEAKASLIEQGFMIGEVTVVPSEMMRDTIVAQSPETGMNVRMGSTVDLTVSGGRVIIPELVGQRAEEALSRIRSIGLSSGLITYETVESARQDGVVLMQSIAPFTEVLPGSELELTVGYYDKRSYQANVSVKVQVPVEGVNVRVTLVGEDGKESDMYAAMHANPGEEEISVLLRSEKSGVMTWRLYLDGGFKSEATAVLQ